MSTEIKTIETLVEHPLEDAFDIEPGTTVSVHTERSSEMVATDQYDNKDDEIDEQFQEIYDRAMAAFEDQVAEAEVVEGKYKARNMEVGVQLLTAALHAAKEKSNQKQHKDKLDVAKKKVSGQTNTQNNVFVGSHKDIIDRLLAKGGNTYDQEE